MNTLKDMIVLSLEEWNIRSTFLQDTLTFLLSIFNLNAYEKCS